MKKLLIKQCSVWNVWYKDKVGQLVPYLGEDDKHYMSREDDGYVNFIIKRDAEVIETP